jgi:CRP-like cAMP-binding protein
METCPFGGSDFQSMATRLDVGTGDRLCVQGRRRQEFGVVVSGRARVLRDGVVVAQLGAGDHFGEFTMLRGLPSPVTIVVEEPSTVDVVTGAEFRGSVGADDACRESLERTLDARIRDWVAAADGASVGERVIA